MPPDKVPSNFNFQRRHKMSTGKLIASLAGVMVLIVLLMNIIGNGASTVQAGQIRRLGYEALTSEYVGEIDIGGVVYTVVITDVVGSDYRMGERVVHLHEPAQPMSYVSITGHMDTLKDTEWRRIFYCGYHKTSDGHMTGCNSVVRVDSGYWKFEACSADDGKVAEFTPKEIGYAETALNIALDEICNDRHLLRRTGYDPVKKERIVYVDRSIKTDSPN